MQIEHILLFSIIPFLTIGFIFGERNPTASEKISTPLVKYGIPISVMGLLLKNGVDLNLLRSAVITFLTILFLIVIINIVPQLKKIFSSYTLQFSGLIGNTSFLGIPIAMALLPPSTIDLTIGFDLGTTFFAWLFGPYLLQNKKTKNNSFNVREILIGIISSPASKGIIGVLITYQLGIETYLGKILWIPAIVIIFLAIIVVGTRLGIIMKKRENIIDFSGGLQYSVLLKLLVFPFIFFILSMPFNFTKAEIAALILQASTPTAISTILMAESYKINQDIAAKSVFVTTIISIFSIPIIRFFLFPNLTH